MRMVVHSPGQLAALISVQEVTSMKDVVDNLGQGERRDRNLYKAMVNVSFIAYESSYLLIILILVDYLYMEDRGLEGKVGGYMQNQRSANVGERSDYLIALNNAKTRISTDVK